MLCCSSLPDLNGGVIAGGCYEFGVGRASEGFDGEGVSAVGMDGRMEVVCGPELDGGVVTSGGDVAAIGSPGEGIDGAGVTMIDV